MTHLTSKFFGSLLAISLLACTEPVQLETAQSAPREPEGNLREVSALTRIHIISELQNEETFRQFGFQSRSDVLRIQMGPMIKHYTLDPEALRTHQSQMGFSRLLKPRGMAQLVLLDGKAKLTALYYQKDGSWALYGYTDNWAQKVHQQVIRSDQALAQVEIGMEDYVFALATPDKLTSINHAPSEIDAAIQPGDTVQAAALVGKMGPYLAKLQAATARQ